MNKLSAELNERITADVGNALEEDIRAGDLTAGLVPESQQAKATVIARHTAILCGSPWFAEVFRQLDPSVTLRWHAEEGDQVKADAVLCELHGSARAILTGERTALNFLQTLSATASAANAFTNAVAGTRATILDTRKTLPGLRLAQKYAVRTGGAANHRTGLYDGILIKENHIVACGGIKQAVAAAVTAANGILVEAEVETLDEARAAMEAGAHRLLLDNFSLDDIRTAVAMRDENFAGITLEASGGVNLDTVQGIAQTGIDFISVGSITKDIRATDLSMRFTML